MFASFNYLISSEQCVGVPLERRVTTQVMLGVSLRAGWEDGTTL